MRLTCGFPVLDLASLFQAGRGGLQANSDALRAAA